MKPNPTLGPAADPVLLLIAAGWLAAEALAVLLIAAFALVLTLARWQPPAASAAAVPSPPVPAPHRPLRPVLTDLADALMELPAAELRRLAGTRRRLPRRELAAMVCAMPI